MKTFFKTICVLSSFLMALTPVYARSSPCPQCHKMSVHHVTGHSTGWQFYENNDCAHFAHGYDEAQCNTIYPSYDECSQCGWTSRSTSSWTEFRVICHGYN